MKKQYVILTIALILLLVVPLSSAFEFDNVKDYDEITGIITIKNLFGLGANIAEIQLVNYKPVCFPGECYMYLNITIYKEDLESLKGSKYYDGKGGVELNNKERKYEIYDETFEYQEKEITEKCEAQVNSTDVCSMVEGKEITKHGAWVDYDLQTKLAIGHYSFREKVDVDAGETVDVVPEFYGIELTEWVEFTGSTRNAHWTQDMDNWVNPGDEIAYMQTFNVTDGDLTLKGIQVKTCMNYDHLKVYIHDVNDSGLPNTQADFTIGALSMNESMIIVAQGCGGSAGDYLNITLPDALLTKNKEYAIVLYASSAGSGMGWVMDSTAGYTNGNSAWANKNGAGLGVWMPFPYDLFFETWGVVDAPVVTLNTPEDASNSTSQNINFNCSGEDDNSNVANLSLWINDAMNITEYGYMNFDGDGDYIKIPYSGDFNVSTGLTISAWIKPNTLLTNDGDIVSKYFSTADQRGWALSINNNKIQMIGCSDGATCVGEVGTTLINDNSDWHFITGVWTGTELLVYYNGVQEGGIGTNLPTLFNSSSDIYFARARRTTYFNGSIDATRLYNRTLTPAEITTIYNYGRDRLGTAPTTDKLVAYYPLDGDATDVIGSNDGVITGATPANLSIYSMLTLPEGITNWTCDAWDSNNQQAWASSNWTINVSIPSPTTILDNPADAIATLDNAQTFICNSNVTTSQMLNLSLWIDDSLVTTEYNTTTYSNLTLSSPQTLSIGYHNWSCEGWSIGDKQGWATANRSVNISSFIENSQTFNATAIETSVEGFTINMSYNTNVYLGATANLIYNGTTYTGDLVGSGGTREFQTTALTPDVNSDSNASFYWEINLVNASANTYFNSNWQNQTISPINMSICGSPHTIPFINFTTYNEETGVEMNATIAVTFTYGQPGSTNTNTFSYEDTTEGNSSFKFCFDPPQFNYEVSTILEYAASGFTQKNYNLDTVTITNSTTDFSLFLLNSTDSTSFIVHVRDSSYQDLIGVMVHVQRYDVGLGGWFTTEISPTDFNGETVGHILTEDADYRFLIYSDGSLIYTTASTKITCQVTPCTVTITVPEGSISSDDLYGDIDEFSYTLTESNLLVSYAYADTSSLFENARLNVVRSDYGTGEFFAPVCDTSNVNSNSLITCDLSPNIISNGTYVARAYVNRTGEGETFVDILRIDKESSAADMIGVDGVLWSIFLIITIVMLGLWRPTVGILFAVVGVIIVQILNIMTLGISSVIAIVVIGGILAFEMRKQ